MGLFEFAARRYEQQIEADYEKNYGERPPHIISDDAGDQKKFREAKDIPIRPTQPRRRNFLHELVIFSERKNINDEEFEQPEIT